MADSPENLSFTLANSESVEIIENAADLDLGSETEGEFAQTACGGFFGRVGTKEIARNIGEEAKARMDKPGPLIDASSTNLLLVPHHFSVRRIPKSLPRSIWSIGIIVDFLPGDENFAIVDLLPNPAYKEVFTARATGDIGVNFSTLTSLFLPVGLGPLVDMVLNGEPEKQAQFGFSMNFGHSFFASEVAATGVGTKTSTFEFFSGSQPLEGRDLTAWSAVAFNQHGKELSCRIRLFYTSRLGVLPKRCESEWIDCTIRTQ